LRLGGFRLLQLLHCWPGAWWLWHSRQRRPRLLDLQLGALHLGLARARARAAALPLLAAAAMHGSRCAAAALSCPLLEQLQRLRCAGPALGLVGKAGPQQPGQGRAAVRMPWQLRLLPLHHHLQGNLGCIAAGKGRAAAEHVHQGGAKGPDVRLGACPLLACQLLWGHVRGGGSTCALQT
jgi:hypothetical protein